MTFELVIISGKGGAGKTSVAAALAALARPVVLADCDVDAPDLHLIARPRVEQEHEFSGGREAEIDAERCLGCGSCADACRFDAIRERPGSNGDATTYEVDPFACEGCGACVPACPSGALSFEPVINGAWLISDTRFGPMAHARLHPGGENSGKLVTLVRREARALAGRLDLPLVLVDGSPGVGCPVIASLTSADLALVVAEPTLSGLHDADRVLQLAEQLRIDAVLSVNRWDLNPRLANRLESMALAHGATPIGRVREDQVIVDAQVQALAATELDGAGAAADLHDLWDRLKAMIPTLECESAPERTPGAGHDG
jgi:MinD superfamily P-loop ATPase